MRALLDVNVLIALFDPDHVHHESTHDWLAENSASGWASCPLTQNGCVRILCQPNYPNAIPAAEAVRRLQGAAAAPEHAFWPDDIALIDNSIFDPAHILNPKAITDIYLLGLAVKNNGRLATFDRGFRLETVAGSADENLVVLGKPRKSSTA